MGINLSESEWCRKATPEVPCRTQGFSQGEPTLGKRQVWFTYSITMTVEPSEVVTLPPYS